MGGLLSNSMPKMTDLVHLTPSKGFLQLSRYTLICCHLVVVTPTHLSLSHSPLEQEPIFQGHLETETFKT